MEKKERKLEFSSNHVSTGTGDDEPACEGGYKRDERSAGNVLALCVSGLSQNLGGIGFGIFMKNLLWLIPAIDAPSLISVYCLTAVSPF